jgi:signal transduction histidine kinase
VLRLKELHLTEETILLLESNPKRLAFMRSAFDSADFDVEAAKCPAEALRVCSERTVAVAIVSIDPESNGTLGLVEMLAQDSAQTECILIETGVGRAVINSLYQRGNIFSHHSGPLKEIASLGMDVARALELRRLRRQNCRLLIELRDARDDMQIQFEFLSQCEKLASLGRVFNDLTTSLSEHISDIERSVKQESRGKLRLAANARNRYVNSSETNALDSIGRSAFECRDIIKGAESFLKGDAARDELIDLLDVIHEGFGLLSSSFRVRGIRVSWDLQDEMHPIIGCRSQLRDVFTHLGSNCMDAMPAGGVITVAAEAVEDGSAICVTVHDTGNGIPQEAVARVFEPFFTTKRPHIGTGLGLSIVRQIVRDHDGDVSIQSEEGRGTLVTLKFAVSAQAVLPQPRLAMAA